MAVKDNKDKTSDASKDPILDETPPDMEIPIPKESEDIEEEPKIETTETTTEETTEEEETPAEGEEETTTTTTTTEPIEETTEDKDKIYRNQQSESQIQKARTDTLVTKIEESNNIPEPTEADLRTFVAQDGGDWDSLTPFEQATQKRLWKSDKRDSLLAEAVKNTKDIDAFAQVVDTFISGTIDKPEYIKLSGHETEFRNYAMKESHRGTPVETLLQAFLFNLPAPAKKRGKLFETAGGGEKVDNSGKITSADDASTLRKTNPKEYARRIKNKTIALNVD